MHFSWFNLQSAINEDYHTLLGAELPAWEAGMVLSTKLAVVFCVSPLVASEDATTDGSGMFQQFPTYRLYTRQVTVLNAQGQPPTRGKMARIIAQEMQKFLVNLAASSYLCKVLIGYHIMLGQSEDRISTAVMLVWSGSIPCGPVPGIRTTRLKGQPASSAGHSNKSVPAYASVLGFRVRLTPSLRIYMSYSRQCGQNHLLIAGPRHNTPPTDICYVGL